MKKLKDECLCRAVRFTAEDAFRYALNCHCSQRRRATILDTPALTRGAGITVDILMKRVP